MSEIARRLHKLSLKKSVSTIEGSKPSQNMSNNEDTREEENISSAQEEPRHKVRDFDMDIDFSLTRHSTTKTPGYDGPKIDQCLEEIEELLRKRHNIATLSFQLAHTQGLPSFMSMYVRFSPRYGSDEARDFIKKGLHSVEENIKCDFKRQMRELCDQYVEDMNTKITVIINNTRTEIGFMSPLSAESRSLLTEKVTNLRNKWEKRYADETTRQSRNDHQNKEDDRFSNLVEKMENLEKLLSGRGGRGGHRGTGTRGTGYRGTGRGNLRRDYRIHPY